MDVLVQNSTSMAKPSIVSAPEYQWNTNPDPMLKEVDRLLKLDKEVIIVKVMSDNVEHLVKETYILTKKKS